MGEPIDADEDATWPEAVRGFVETWSAKLRGTCSFASSLEIPNRACEEFRSMLAGRLIRAYHCTRLLDHERDSIVERGMQPLTRQLIEQRIRDAHAIGAITKLQRERYLACHAFTSTDHGVNARKDIVCLFYPSGLLGAGSMSDYLSTWGGEVLVSYLGWGSTEAKELNIGRPGIVVANVDVTEPRAWLGTEPAKTFVGMRLALHAESEIQITGPIAPDHIEAILHPGDPRYDRHAGLPRC